MPSCLEVKMSGAGEGKKLLGKANVYLHEKRND